MFINSFSYTYTSDNQKLEVVVALTRLLLIGVTPAHSLSCVIVYIKVKDNGNGQLYLSITHKTIQSACEMEKNHSREDEPNLIVFSQIN